jgi:hypothetical protein
MTTQAYNLVENLENGDLKRLINPVLHIDEYKSKMGEDQDICVVSVKVGGKEPAMDLVSFIEKGYDWVLDADVSSGEKEDGDYLVFIEMDRTPEIPVHLVKLVDDILNLTGQSIDDWTFVHYRSSTKHALNLENLKNELCLTAETYQERFGEDNKDLDALKTAAGVDVDTKAPDNDFTESLRVAAGIK